MNFGESAVKLTGIKTYNTNTNHVSDVFQRKFYSDVQKKDYNVYEEIKYNAIDIESAIEEAKNYQEETWYEKLYSIGKTIRDCCVTFEASVVCGALEIVENVGDALITYGAKAASSIVSAWDPDLANEIKDEASKIVQYDWTEALYDEMVELADIDSDIAYSGIHDVGNFVGTTAAYVATSCIPGGAAVTATVGAVTAFGSASEMALQCGADFDEAYLCGSVAGIAGAVTGGVLNKVQGAARASTSLFQVGGYALIGAGVSAAEPFINTTTQYVVYGKDAVDENGNPLYDDYVDYYVKSGGLFQTGIAAAVGGTSTGFQGVKGYNEVKAYASNENIDAKQLKTAEKNYKNNKDLFTNRKDYYDILDYVEKNVYWEELPDGTTRKVTLSADDPGLTKCLSEKGKAVFYDEIAKNTVDGKIKTNNYNTNVSGFIEYVLGTGDDYGTLGRSNDYNFACIGSADDSISAVKQKQKTSNGFINSYENSRGTDATKSQRIIFTEADVDVNTVSMHSGKEQGSNSYRLAGNKLPDGSNKLVYKTVKIDSANATNINAKIYDDAGNCLFSGSMSDLKNIQKNDINKFNNIMGITKPIE